MPIKDCRVEFHTCQVNGANIFLHLTTIYDWDLIKNTLNKLVSCMNKRERMLNCEREREREREREII